MKMIDIEDVRAACRAMSERAEPEKDRNDELGAVARIQIAVAPALAEYRANELNRETTAYDVITSMCTLFAASIAGEIQQRRIPEEARPHLVGFFAARFSSLVLTLLSDEQSAYTVKVDPKRGGGSC